MKNKKLKWILIIITVIFVIIRVNISPINRWFPIVYTPSVEGVVRDSKSEEPISNAIIVAIWEKWQLGIIEGHSAIENSEIAITDNQGRYKIPSYLGIMIISDFLGVEIKAMHPLYEQKIISGGIEVKDTISLEKLAKIKNEGKSKIVSEENELRDKLIGTRPYKGENSEPKDLSEGQWYSYNSEKGNYYEIFEKEKTGNIHIKIGSSWTAPIYYDIKMMGLEEKIKEAKEKEARGEKSNFGLTSILESYGDLSWWMELKKNYRLRYDLDYIWKRWNELFYLYYNKSLDKAVNGDYYGYKGLTPLKEGIERLKKEGY